MQQPRHCEFIFTIITLFGRHSSLQKKKNVLVLNRERESFHQKQSWREEFHLLLPLFIHSFIHSLLCQPIGVYRTLNPAPAWLFRSPYSHVIHTGRVFLKLYRLKPPPPHPQRKMGMCTPELCRQLWTTDRPMIIAITKGGQRHTIEEWL